MTAPVSTTDHPRPLLQRPWQSLDGKWEFALDHERRIDHPGQVDFNRSIVVPFAPETPASGIGADGYVERCWYRLTVAVEPPTDSERIVVHFAGVDRIADVWANGDHVGHHVGGYTSFGVDVTAAAIAGTLELVVCADDDGRDLNVPRGKQDWQPTPHSIFYPRTTGIWKTVWIERTSTTRIECLDWVTDAAAMTITLRAEISIGPDHMGDGQLRLAVRLAAGDHVLIDDMVSIAGQGSTRSVERTFTVGTGSFDDRFALTWWPTRPTIIDADLTLTTIDSGRHGSGDVLDTVASYTAIRSVEVRNGQFLLNGRPYPMRLVLDQGYWPDTGATPPNVAALERDIELTKALGFNGARKHQKTEDPRYLALADRMGLLVWVEMPSAYRPGDERRPTCCASGPTSSRPTATTHRWWRGYRSTSRGASTIANTIARNEH